MGKRILSLLLALVMVLGMVPAMAFAAETNLESAAVINAVRSTVTADGKLDEERWALVGQLTGQMHFGAMYEPGKLYIFRADRPGLGYIR